MNDNWLVFVFRGFCVISVLFGFFLAWVAFGKDTICLTETKWKCKHAVIINDDPSKTECVIYKRNDQE